MKGKISFAFLETIIIVLSEFKYLEGLVKLAKKHKDEETQQVIHIVAIHVVPTIKQVNINRNHKGKTLHLTIEVHNGLIERLVDTSAFILVMVTTIVRELRIMHLVSGNESYKTTYGTITKALGRITYILMKVGNVQCNGVSYCGHWQL